MGEGVGYERLAQRSTGLGEPKPARESQERSDAKELSRMWQIRPGLGIQFAPEPVAVFWLIGRATADNHMKWNQAATFNSCR